ncbi:MAG: hypothetical protein IPG96_14105 [Proteobacteria bacterium]|nr:hypothetical protein [Pseudomonadota bacterium]
MMRRCTGSGSGRAAIVVWVLLGWLAGAARGADDREPAAGARFAPRAVRTVALGDDLNAHVHLSGVLTGPELVALAAREGTLGAGLEALALGTGDFAEQTRTAATLLTASAHYDHYALYGLRGRFIAAAFPGARYGVWLAAALHALRRQARRTLVAEGADDAERAILTARQWGLSLEGIGFLLSERRPRSRDAQATARVLRRFPDEVRGLNLHGPEAGAGVEALHAALDQLLRYRPHGDLLLHAGELDTPNGGRDTVNRYLEVLAERARSEPLAGKTGGLQPILAHGAHIADPERAHADLVRAARQGIVTALNPQPLANLAYATVSSAGDIAIAELVRRGWPFVAFGTDNVGTFALNRWSVLLPACRPGRGRRSSARAGGGADSSEMADAAALHGAGRRQRLPSAGARVSRPWGGSHPRRTAPPECALSRDLARAEVAAASALGVSRPARPPAPGPHGLARASPRRPLARPARREPRLGRPRPGRRAADRRPA